MIFTSSAHFAKLTHSLIFYTIFAFAYLPLLGISLLLAPQILHLTNPPNGTHNLHPFAFVETLSSSIAEQ